MKPLTRSVFALICATAPGLFAQAPSALMPPTSATVETNSPAPAPQVPPPAPTPAPGSPIKIGGVTFSGSLRTRLYGWDWFEPAAGNNEYAYSGNLLRFGFSQSRDGWDWNAEFSVPFLLGLPLGATGTGANQGALGLGSNYLSANSGSRNTAMFFPKQLYVRIGEGKGHSLQLGRFEFLDGSEITPKNATLANVKANRVAQRLIGNFGWSDVQRSFDGFRYSYNAKADNFTLIGAVPTRGVFQTDGWGWNRAAFGYASYTHEWGTGRHAADTRAFFIEYDDFRHILKTDNRPVAVRRADLENIRINTIGGHTLHTYEASGAKFDFLAWGAAQTGRWGVERQRSGAYDFEGGIQPKILSKLKPWIRGGHYWGSGDGNPNDKTHETFFQILPTPRPYAKFPFFNMMNTEETFGILILRPHPKVTTTSEFHALRLSDANDFWYAGGGIYQPWTFGYTGRSTSGRKSLGNLYDTSVEYRATKKVTLTGYFGYTQGLAAMETIYPKGRDGRFGYLEGLFKF